MPSSRAAAWRPRARFLANLALVIIIVVVDWNTPAGIVVGMLLSVPILISSASDDPREVWAIAALAVTGKVVASIFGRPPISPEIVWIPNRIFATLTVVASAGISLMLQRRRVESVRARDEALSARDLNRLLLSLLAHDLRTPLAVAEQAWGLVENRGGAGLDPRLVSDVRQRLGRSRRAIDAVMHAAHAEFGSTDAGAMLAIRPLREIEEEVHSFEREALTAGKQLVLDLEGDRQRHCAIDSLVLRQLIAILLDNAVRYAVPGRIRVAAELNDERLLVWIEDGGPGLTAHRAASGGSAGSGLGLELCRLLARRANGELTILRDSSDGTTFRLSLPAPPAPALA